ncbi:MAG TPA: carboxyl transferase domain-containing protein [Bacteroidales bacterium]|nr:carboxyl transferase domain-containing protein [Bacteroidales bacterium]
MKRNAGYYLLSNIQHIPVLKRRYTMNLTATLNYFKTNEMNDLTVLKSNVKTGSDEYKSNYNETIQIIDDFKKKLQKVTERNDDPYVQKHKSKGKWLARERINALIDSQTEFYEFSALATNDLYEAKFHSAGIVTGIGIIQGIESIIIANDPTVKGGTYVNETIKKHLRAQEIAYEHHLPCVYIVESGGIFLPEQANVFADKDHFGKIFYNQSRLSAAGIPQIAMVMGSCTAGGAYIPAMSDESIIVENQGTIFLAGPPLVKAAIGETVSAEDLGGANAHTHISGVADYMAKTEEEAIQVCRNIFENLPKPKKSVQRSEKVEEPLYPAKELYGIIHSQSSRWMNPYEIIARIIDGSRFQEFKPNYGKTLVTGFARIKGQTVGIIANNGVLFSESALKGTHFIEMCSIRKIPLVFLHNISGFMVGKDAEHKGIAKDGAKMVHAVSNTNVPKITIIYGRSHGAGNYAMAGRAYNPNLLFTWPNAKISVMGGRQAAEVLWSVKKNGSDNKEELKKQITERYEQEGSAYYSTSRIWDDGIIDPLDTRKMIALGLSIAANKEIPDYKPGIYRM